MGVGTFFSDLAERIVGRYERLDEREFLPAALEVVETPPSPTGRALGRIIVLFFVIALVWAFVGKVDVLATAPGRIIPAGDIKTIQPLDPGTVRAIYVQDGQHVRSGQLLIALDPTQSGADRDRLSGDLIEARLDVARFTALWQATTSGRPPQFIAPADVPQPLVDQARAAMQAQWDQQVAKVADLSQQISEKGVEAEQYRTEADEISASTPLLMEKEHIHQELTAQGYGTNLAYLDAQQQVVQAQHEVNVQAEHAAQSVDARAALQQTRAEARSQFAADVLDGLHKAQQQVGELSQDLVKAQNKSSETELRSPIDGVVDQLEVHTANGVVTPAETLMIIVPDSRDLMVEARLSDQDVGFVHAGQTVNVKVNTYNFTRYGLLKGRVVDVSSDVITQDPRHGLGGSTAQTAQGAQPSYIVRIALDQTSMMVDGHREPLLPGMAITVEIRTGARTIVDYLLSPLARKTEESLHER